MNPEDNYIVYIVKHYICTDYGLKWVKCGPDCQHEPAPDVHHGGLQSVIVPGEDIEWVGE
jgi:hypothetical protein